METQSQGQTSTRISDLPVWQGQKVSQQTPQAPQQIPQQQSSYSPQVTPQVQQQHMSPQQPIQQFKGHSTGELPSRDIPMHTERHMIDENSKTNYIPTPEKHVRFVEEEDQEELQENEQRNENFESSVFRYREPLILMLLFFIFQMSIVNAKLYQFIPKLFVQEGELSGSGVILKAGLFVAVYLGIQYVIKNGMKVI
jgi:hypothetical protein